MIYDFNISLTKSWDRRTGVYLKKWARIFRNADVGILYRSRTMFGLQLTPPSSHFKKMQLIKSHILKHSPDPSIRALYNARSSRESSFRHKNRGSHFLSHVEPVVNHNLKFPSQRDRQGLGHSGHNKPHNNKEHRALLVAALLREESDKLYAHSITLVLQGVWTHWIDYVEPFDMSWNTIIYHIQPKLLSFMLNAMINSLPTPDLLRMWNIQGDISCYRCHCSLCTLHHILVNCYPALKGKRYNWRHDSVLSTLHPMLTNQINSFNSSSSSSNPIQLPIHFIQAGNTSTKGIRSQRSSLLMDATDWQLLVDYDRRPIIFPPDIIPTNERPDLIIWPLTSKRVILFELTCGAEEGIPAAAKRKIKRYHKLKETIIAAGWKCIFRTMEVGARGFVAHSTRRCLSSIGYSYSNALRICKQLSLVSARCSYAIWLSRKHKHWDRTRSLISVPISLTITKHKPPSSRQ